MSKKLLLADDSITIQKVIQITFAHEDYELTITDNGDAAFAKAQEIKPDLVMADVYMPGKNGYELTSAIKQDPALQNVPVLLLAGSFEPFDEDKARDCKANAWIEKPFESQSLIDKVAELLSAAPQAAEAPAPAAEPEPTPVAAPAVEAVAEEPDLSSFDEPLSAAPEPAEPPAEDYFGDISFEEEAPAAEPEPMAAADDWGDMALEEEAEGPAAEETFGVEEESFAAPAEEISFAEDFSAAEEAPVAEAEFDTFDMGGEEIMPLGDDDILGAEDLEPAPEEPTLAAWSRSATEADDMFGESLEETPTFEEDVFAAEPVTEEATSVFEEEEPVAAFAEPAMEETPVFEEETAFEEPFAEEPFPAEPEVAFEEEAEPVAAAAVTADVEARAASLGEAEIEQIIEKVVAKVVEKLAGSIIEKVAWEVVPDLAESMIKEEIRKIKDAAA